MIDILDLLTIHPYDIEVTADRIADVFDELHIDYDDLESKAMDEYLVGNVITDDLGNQINSALLNAAKDILLDKIKPFKPEINLYVNGLDSHFELSESDKDIIKAMTIHNLPYETVLWAKENFPLQNDFDYFVSENLDCYHEALNYLADANARLVWSYIEELDEYDSINEVLDKENEFLKNPDWDNAILVGKSSQIYTIDAYPHLKTPQERR